MYVRISMGSSKEPMDEENLAETYRTSDLLRVFSMVVFIVAMAFSAVLRPIGGCCVK
jgi:hypothetical protein